MLELFLLLWMLGTVGSRAIKGPQPQFARLSLVLLVAGLWLMGSSDETVESAGLLTGVLLTQLGMLVAVVMITIQAIWQIKHRKPGK